MFDMAIGLLEGVVKTHELYKGMTNIIFGDKKEEYLQQIATDMKDMKVHIEKLSDKILYAVNLDGVRACKEKEQKYAQDFDKIHDLLAPMQRALNKPILSSALIEAPMPALKHPRLRLKDISPLKYLVIPYVDFPWVPMLFEENGEYYVGWQTPEYLSQELGCEYQPQWQPNHNVMPKSDPFLPTSLKKVFHDPLKDGGDGPEMVWIPAGLFRMGDIKGTGSNDEQPVHEVSIERFAMGRYPVTFAEYDQFAEATGRKKPNDEGWGRDNRPVINVSWHDAVAYTEWLSEQTGQQYRLPTEAEWEYGARAGTETDYWWGNEIGKNRANCSGSGSQWSGKQTSPVGSFEANPFGLYDTAGNIWEWTCSEYEDTYRGKELRCFEKSHSKSIRLSLRGGSWVNGGAGLRSAVRGSGRPTDRGGFLGFRVSRL